MCRAGARLRDFGDMRCTRTMRLYGGARGVREPKRAEEGRPSGVRACEGGEGQRRAYRGVDTGCTSACRTRTADHGHDHEHERDRGHEHDPWPWLRPTSHTAAVALWFRPSPPCPHSKVTYVPPFHRSVSPFNITSRSSSAPCHAARHRHRHPLPIALRGGHRAARLPGRCQADMLRAGTGRIRCTPR
jgi:hypothetical protein